MRTTCNKCGKSFSGPRMNQALSGHIRIVHEGQRPNGSGKRHVNAYAKVGRPRKHIEQTPVCFCPQCGLNLGMLLRAMNAVNRLAS